MKLYLTAGNIIVNLFRVFNKSYITLDDIDKYSRQMYDYLDKENILNNYDDLIIHIEENDIIRFVLYNNTIFELVGNTIYIKSEKIPKSILEEYYSEVILNALKKVYEHSCK